ncbi:transposase [Streptomyces morookaense]|uniref:IS701 family transposase n=1 Tax=Streptomyces morookaense TaxID=1970 RepID=UPI0033E30A08
MSSAALYPDDVIAPKYAGAHDAVLVELCSELFASLPRSDQRRKGREYLQGLLGGHGRKSIRNIAAIIGGPATEQSMHHFISSSIWDWNPVRRALVRHLLRSAPPQAWVVRPMVIPKGGRHSVGVDRKFFPALGQVLNAQQAVGVWAVSEEMAAPVNWRLHLSDDWLRDDARRARAAIPDCARPESLGDCAASAFLETAGWGVPVRPVVLDVPEADTWAVVRRLRAAGVPWLVRIGSTLRLTAADPALPGCRTEGVTAHQIMTAAAGMRRPVLWSDHDAAETLRTSLAAGVRVRMPVRGVRTVPVPPPVRRAGVGDLRLLGEWEQGRSAPGELWLTDMTGLHPVALMQLSKVTRRVDRDFAEIADRVGIRDYTGRSYKGWHRHVTLASAAHTVAALGRGGGPAGGGGGVVPVPRLRVIGA